MRNYLTYLSLLFICTIFSCQKHNPEGPDGLYSEGGIISFSTSVNTKAPIITEMNGRHFGVYGYAFSNLTNWNTYKTSATPNLFYRLDVYCDGANGACSYSVDTDTDINGKEQWELNKRYAFFAYYPYSVNYVVPSDNTHIDNPYIDYSLPFASGARNIDPDVLQDIMTSKVIDYSPVQGTEVRFEFDHRLFCIELYGHNFNAEDIKISDLTMTVSGIHYNKAKIYMDSSVPTVPTSGVLNNVQFAIQPNEQTLKSGVDATSISGDKNIVLIPQNSSASGAVGLTVQIDFKKDGVSVDPRRETFYVDFIPGRKYRLTLNFIGEDVVMVVGDPAPWDSKDVNHTFN